MMEDTARKKTREEKPGVSKNCGATQSYKNTLDSNSYLTYDILRIIFQYLNAKDLGSAAMVCRSWLEAANHEKSTIGPCFTQICIDNPYLRSYKDDYLYKVENIRIKPSAGFFFIPKNSKNTHRNIEGLIENLLPEHCEAIMLYCDEDFDIDDIIFIFHKNVALLLERPDKFPYVGCAFLPQIPDVRIKSFKVAECFIIQKSAQYQEIIKTIVDHETFISNTCFMLFCNYEGRSTAIRWASAMQESKEVKIASVWGGSVDEIYVQHKRKKKLFPKTDVPDCVAVLITGSIQTWSTILDEKCDTKEQVEARLKLFKDKVKLKKHSIGFMFSCRTRETATYKKSNVKSSVKSTIFKRLFPKVPLAVCFGSYNSAFGKTTTVDEINEEKNDEEKHECKKSSSWYNESCTVFLILTYG